MITTTLKGLQLSSYGSEWTERQLNTMKFVEGQTQNPILKSNGEEVGGEKKILFTKMRGGSYPSLFIWSLCP